MALPNEIHPFLTTGNDPNQFKVLRSLRFRSSASTYLNRPYDAGGYTGWFCYSFWVKRGSLGSAQTIHSGGSSGSNYGYLGFTSGDAFTFYDSASGTAITLTTTQLFRDPAAWYHFFIQIDTTQATASNRVKIWVNGSQVTSFSTSTYPNQNIGLGISYIGTKSVGTLNYTGATPSNYFDGYLSEFYKFSGQTLSYTTFTDTDPITGQLRPKRYTGTFNNGDWYLPFNTLYSDNLLFYFNGDYYGKTAYSVDGSAAANGTIGANTTIVAGKSTGNAFNFNGTIDSYVDTGLSTSYPSQFSISAWFKTTATPADGQVIVSKNSYYASATTDFPFVLQISSGGQLNAGFDGGNDYSSDMAITSAGGYNDGNWHHLVITYKAANSVYMYIDGSVAASNTNNGVTISNNSRNWFIGRDSLPYSGGSPGRPFTGQIDEVRLYSVQLTATDVTNLYKGDDALSNYGIGVDRSGYATDFEPVNLSLVPGTTYDSMIDTPTAYNDGGNNRGNYAVLNPISNPNGTIVTYLNGNLGFSHSSSSGNAPKMSVTATIGVTTGKWYFEFIAGSTVNDQMGISNGLVYGGTANGSKYAFYTNSGSFSASPGTTSGSPASYTTNDIIGVAFDIDAQTVNFYKNNVLQGSISSIGVDTWYPQRSPGSSTTGGSGSFNFGQRPFAYTPPAGYLALNTYNLPNPSLPLV